MSEPLSNVVSELWINCNQLQKKKCIPSHGGSLRVGDEPDPWHCTARVRTLETEGVRNLNLGSAYGGVMRVHSMRHGPGTEKCGVPLPCGKYAGPSIRRCALSDETSRVTLPPEMDVCQGPLVYGLWKARLFLQVNTAIALGCEDDILSKDDVFLSEEISFVALSNKRNNLLSQI